ncbi:hypothetical protein B4V12_003662 [Shigella boydii]|nr:hypothetical protein [Shigella boydii]
MMWNIMVLMSIYIPDLQRKSFFHALFLQIFLYGRRFCCGLIHKEMHLVVGWKRRLVDFIEPGGAG